MGKIRKRTSIVILLDHIDGMEELSDKEFGGIIRDYADYVKSGVEPEYKTPYKRLIWKNIKNFDALNVTKMEARQEAIERYKKKKKGESVSNNTQINNQGDSSDIFDIKNISDNFDDYVSVPVSSSVSSSVFVPVSVSESESVSVDYINLDNKDTKESIANAIPKKKSTPKPNHDYFKELAGNDKELADALKAFSEMRNKIKKPMTDRAKKMLCEKLNKEFQPCEWVAILNQSIYHGWQDVYALKEDAQQTGYQQNQTNQTSALDEQFARVAEMMGADW